MTKSPLEEFLESLAGHGVAVHVIEIEDDDASRADKIKACWSRAILDAPENAMDVKDGEMVMSYPDPDHDCGKRIEFYLLRYGDKRVIECEGVVVCHLLT